MKKTITITILLACLSGSCYASQRWDIYEEAAYLGFMAALAGDMWTTSQGRDKGYTERNGVLGGKPSNTRLVMYGSAAAWLTWELADILPPKYRKTFLTSMLSLEIECIRHNAVYCEIKF